MEKAVRIWFFVLLCFLSTVAFALELTPESPFRNLNSLSRELGMSAYTQATRLSPRKTARIAILDNGFNGYEAEIGKTLPANTTYHAGPIAPPTPQESHGLYMAQMVSGLLTASNSSPQLPFELHLFAASGYTNLAAAIEHVSNEKFDVVLYSQVWEYGGNGDGHGFINSLVNKATQAGVLWINAAGNYHTLTYHSGITRTQDDWAKLPGPNESVRLRCLKHATPKGSDKSGKADQSGKCHIRLVLSWNDFKDDPSLGTDKDLDLVLTDDTLGIVQASTLQQKLQVPDGERGSSKYPREIIEADVKPGLYYARVKIRSANFAQRDQLTLLASGDFIEMVDASSDETLLNPADNASVITVGAADSPHSGRSRRLRKPELIFPSIIELNNGDKYLGTSNSAAMVAAATAVVRMMKPEATRADLLRLLADGRGAPRGDRDPGQDQPAQGGRGFPLEMLGFFPTNGVCFSEAVIATPYPHLQPLLRDGGRPVQTTAGIKIFVAFDPLTRISGLRRFQPNDMIVVDSRGYTILPRASATRLGSGVYEVVETPLGQSLCSDRDNHRDNNDLPNGKRARLPPPERLN